jgi:Trypsin
MPYNDIGIAKTTEPFRLSETIQLANIADNWTGKPTAGSTCTVVGYGSTQHPDWDRPEVVRLRYMNVPILEDQVCEWSYALFDGQTMVCAGSPDKLMGSDSVSALVLCILACCNEQSSRVTQAVQCSAMVWLLLSLKADLVHG